VDEEEEQTVSLGVGDGERCREEEDEDEDEELERVAKGGRFDRRGRGKVGRRAKDPARGR